MTLLDLSIPYVCNCRLTRYGHVTSYEQTLFDHSLSTMWTGDFFVAIIIAILKGGLDENCKREGSERQLIPVSQKS